MSGDWVDEAKHQACDLCVAVATLRTRREEVLPLVEALMAIVREPEKAEALAKAALGKVKW